MSMLNKEFSKMNYDSLKNRDMAKSKGGKYSIEAEESFKKYLKELNDTKNFNSRLFDKGVEYFNAGGSFDSIPTELRNNESFVRGYKHAERLSQIEIKGNIKGR